MIRWYRGTPTYLGKCTKLFAVTAEKNAKFLSNLTLADQYIAGNVGQKEDEHVGDIKIS